MTLGRGRKDVFPADASPRNLFSEERARRNWAGGGLERRARVEHIVIFLEIDEGQGYNDATYVWADFSKSFPLVSLLTQGQLTHSALDACMKGTDW